MIRFIYTPLIVLLLVFVTTTSMAARKDDTSSLDGATESVEGVDGVDGALLHCDTMLHNFGEVERRRSEIEHTFTIENRGDAPLIITRVLRSCSCMKAHISKRPIAVGERRELKVVYEVHKMPEGLFSKVVQIYSTSRDGGFAQFTITGRSVVKE